MNIAICDDNLEQIETIKKYIEDFVEDDSTVILNTFEDGLQVLKKYEEQQSYDVIFFDIEMEKSNGIDVALKIRKMDKDVILFFISSHTKYVSNAFLVDAFQFLVKPINEIHFKREFQRVLDAYRQNHTLYTVKTKSGLVVLELIDMLYLEGYGRKIMVHTRRENFEKQGKLREDIEHLKQYGFVQVHQGFCVNMHHIKEIGEALILLDNKVEIPLSVRKRSQVIQTFHKFLSGRVVC